MWNQKQDMNLSMKQKQNHGHKEQAGGCQEGVGDGLGVWDQQMPTGIYRKDKQQGATVQERELNSISYDNP